MIIALPAKTAVIPSCVWENSSFPIIRKHPLLRPIWGQSGDRTELGETMNKTEIHPHAETFLRVIGNAADAAGDDLESLALVARVAQIFRDEITLEERIRIWLES